MKSIKRNILLLISMLFVNAPNVLANGIPTVDGATIGTIIGENVKSLAEYAKQLEQLEAQFNEMKSQGEAMAKRFEGNLNLGDLLNTDSFYSFLPKAGDDKLNGYFGTVDLAKLREEFALNSKSAEVQKAYDYKLKKYGKIKERFKSLSKRTEKLKELKVKADKAQTPQEKQDVANAMAYENIQMQNEQAKAEELAKMMTEAEDLENAGKLEKLENEIEDLRRTGK